MAADFKLTNQDEWMISYLDDHSRFIPGSSIHHNPTAPACHQTPRRIHQAIRQARSDPHRPGNPILPRTRRHIDAHRIFHWKQDRPHRHQHTEAFNHKQDRSISQSLHLRSLDLPNPQRIRKLLELRAPTSRNRLSISSRRILQIPETSHWIEHYAKRQEIGESVVFRPCGPFARVAKRTIFFMPTWAHP